MEKSIKHLMYRFGQERIMVNQADIDALNIIIEGFNQIERDSIKRNKLFFKLFINEFLREGVLNENTAKGSFAKIEGLLKKPLSEYYKALSVEIPYIRFYNQAIKEGFKPLYEIRGKKVKVNNTEEVLKHNEAIVSKNQKLLQQMLTKEYTEEQAKTFIDTELFKMLLEYSKYD